MDVCLKEKFEAIRQRNVLLAKELKALEAERAAQHEAQQKAEQKEYLARYPTYRKWLAARRRSQLSPQQVMDLRRQGLTIKAISDKADISTTAVAQIIRKEERREQWRAEHSGEQVQLSERTMNCLKNDNLVQDGEIVRIEWLLERSETELLQMPNFGRRSLEELKTWLAERGLHLQSLALAADDVARKFGSSSFRLTLPPNLMERIVQAAAADNSTINDFIVADLEKAMADR